MSDNPLQTSLFEEDYLLRELGQVARVPQVALTELVANARVTAEIAKAYVENEFEKYCIVHRIGYWRAISTRRSSK